MAAAIVGVLLGWQRVRAANNQADAQIRQAELARRGHVAELINRAVGQLTDKKLEIRLGAVYMLEQISADFPDLSEHVVELLGTYLRENRVDYGKKQPPADLRAIIRVVAAKLENRE